MSLSLLLFLIGILGYISNYTSDLNIKIIFSPLNIFLILILCNIYVNEIDETMYTICFVLYTSFSNLFTAMSYYPNLSLLTVLFISVAVLYYINFVNIEFKFKYPKLYNILCFVCFILIFICIISLMYTAINSVYGYILKSSGGEPSSSSGPSSNPGKPGGSGGSGGSGGPGGSDNSGIHGGPKQRKKGESISDLLNPKTFDHASFSNRIQAQSNGIITQRLNNPSEIDGPVSVTMGDLKIRLGSDEANFIKEFAEDYKGSDINIRSFCTKVLGRGQISKSNFSDITIASFSTKKLINPTKFIGNKILNSISEWKPKGPV